jgi:hypothetical protein
MAPWALVIAEHQTLFCCLSCQSFLQSPISSYVSQGKLPMHVLSTHLPDAHETLCASLHSLLGDCFQTSWPFWPPFLPGLHGV